MRPRHLALTIGGVGGLLALVGLWLGHTLEYVRVWGTHGLQTVVAGSIHAYMLPLALLLILAAALAGGRMWRVWMRLGARVDGAHLNLTALLHGRRLGARIGANDDVLPSLPARILAAWPALTLVQILFYVVQENVEAAVANAPAPGFGAVTGAHALAPLVHAAVALLLLVAVAGVVRLLRRRIAVIAAVEAIVRLLLSRLEREPCANSPSVRAAAPPLYRFGAHLWRRPPPALLAI
jgi:hypothetical protein